MKRIAGDERVRVVIVTGTGRAFCAGGDLLEFGDRLDAGSALLLEDLEYNQAVLKKLEDIAVPVIGVANGTAVAGGLELLLCCDIVLAAEGVKIGDGLARYGIVPAGGATVRLPRKIGPARAAKLFYTADLADAQILQLIQLEDSLEGHVAIVSGSRRGTCGGVLQPRRGELAMHPLARAWKPDR